MRSSDGGQATSRALHVSQVNISGYAMSRRLSCDASHVVLAFVPCDRTDGCDYRYVRLWKAKVLTVGVRRFPCVSFAVSWALMWLP